MTNTQKKTILTEIVKGENGVVDKAELTEAKITALDALVGEELDCLHEFLRPGKEEGDTIAEVMYCGMFRLSDDEDKYLVERDMVDNHEEGSAKHTLYLSKDTITL